MRRAARPLLFACALAVAPPAMAEAPRPVVASLQTALGLCHAHLGKYKDLLAAFAGAGWRGDTSFPHVLYFKDGGQLGRSSARAARPAFCSVRADGLTEAQAEALLRALVKSTGSYQPDTKEKGLWRGTANGRKAALFVETGSKGSGVVIVGP